MRDDVFAYEPPALSRIVAEGESLGFRAASERRTGALLRILAASKPGGRLLELGTGTGVGTAWLLGGMDRAARLDTVDRDETVVAVARRHLGDDSRVRFHVADGESWLGGYAGPPFDLIRRRLAGEVQRAGGRAGAAGGRRAVRHRRPARPGELAGRSCGADRTAPRRRRAGARSGVRADGVGEWAGDRGEARLIRTRS